jgi:type II secretory pathway predicted ATPase ExeA
MTEPTRPQKQQLRTYFRLSHMPFSKYMWARHMFDSASQRELLHGLVLWTELRGLALVTGPSGVGKSITLRRYLGELDEARCRVVTFTQQRSTLAGFLRSLSRSLELPVRHYVSDLFDQVQKHLVAHEQERGAHPIVVLDDAEGLRVEVFDAIRRLTAYELDGQDRFSVLLSGTEELVRILQHPQLVPLRSRFGYAQQLRAFGLDDTRNYIRYHLERADADPTLFTDEAVRRIFQASHGRPRHINQLAIGAMIQAAVLGREQIDGDFLSRVIASHPLYPNTGAER